MKDFTYCKPTKIIFGKNAVEEIAGILADAGKKKAILICRRTDRNVQELLQELTR